MKKLLLACLFFCLVSPFALAQVENDEFSFNGMIIDVQNAIKNKDRLADFINEYTKEEALTPQAIESGYGIFMEDSYMKFDAESNAKIVEFLNNPDSTLEVTIMASVGQNDILTLISIMNQ